MTFFCVLCVKFNKIWKIIKKTKVIFYIKKNNNNYDETWTKSEKKHISLIKNFFTTEHYKYGVLLVFSQMLSVIQYYESFKYWWKCKYN